MSTTRAAKLCGCAHEPLRYLARIGLWGDARGWLRRYSPTLALAQAVYGLATQVINVAQTWGKLALAAEYCVALLQMLMTCVKIRCLLANTCKIQEVVTTLDKMRDANECVGDVTDIVQHTRAMSETFARVVHILCAPTLFIFTVGLVIAGYFKHEIPFRRWYPHNAKSSPLFELSLMSFQVLTYFDYYFILLFDLLVLCLLIEVVGEFRVLKYHLSRVDQSDTKRHKKLDFAGLKKRGNEVLNARGYVRGREARPNVKGAFKHQQFLVITTSRSIQKPSHFQVGLNFPWTKIKIHKAPDHIRTSEQRLAVCVKQHYALISLVSKLEAMFQPALVVHLVCNLSVGLTLAYVTLKSERMNMKMTSMLAIGLVCVGEFALYCFFCTQITTESSLLGESLYSCDWLNASAGFKRSLRIVQLRTNRPLIIRAATIFPMSMKTFTKIMNTAYKLYGLMITTN